MKKYLNHFKRHVTHHTNKAIKLKSTPHTIALSFAIGTFIAVFPTFFLGLFIILGLMIFYKKLNKIAAIGGLMFWNFIMMVPVYYLSYNIGRFFFRKENAPTLVGQGSQFFSEWIKDPFNIDIVISFITNNLTFIKEYFLGNLIVSILCSGLSYFIIKRAVIAYREAKERKQKNNFNNNRNK